MEIILGEEMLVSLISGKKIYSRGESSWILRLEEMSDQKLAHSIFRGIRQRLGPESENDQHLMTTDCERMPYSTSADVGRRK